MVVIYMENLFMAKSGLLRPNEHIVFINMFASCAGVIKEILKMKIEELSTEDTSDMHKQLLCFYYNFFQEEIKFQDESTKTQLRGKTCLDPARKPWDPGGETILFCRCT
jgi:hypothetical protein